MNFKYFLNTVLLFQLGIIFTYCQAQDNDDSKPIVFLLPLPGNLGSNKENAKNIGNGVATTAIAPNNKKSTEEIVYIGASNNPQPKQANSTVYNSLLNILEQSGESIYIPFVAVPPVPTAGGMTPASYIKEAIISYGTAFQSCMISIYDKSNAVYAEYEESQITLSQAIKEVLEQFEWGYSEFKFWTIFLIDTFNSNSNLTSGWGNQVLLEETGGAVVRMMNAIDIILENYPSKDIDQHKGSNLNPLVNNLTYISTENKYASEYLRQVNQNVENYVSLNFLNLSMNGTINTVIGYYEIMEILGHMCSVFENFFGNVVPNIIINPNTAQDFVGFNRFLKELSVTAQQLTFVLEFTTL